jgi:hypothetical protein
MPAAIVVCPADSSFDKSMVFGFAPMKQEAQLIGSHIG